MLFNDLEDDEAKELVKFPSADLHVRIRITGPPPAWAEPEFAGTLGFKRCMQDQALPPFLQDKFIEESGVK